MTATATGRPEFTDGGNRANGRFISSRRCVSCHWLFVFARLPSSSSSLRSRCPLLPHHVLCTSYSQKSPSSTFFFRFLINPLAIQGRLPIYRGQVPSASSHLHLETGLIHLSKLPFRPRYFHVCKPVSLSNHLRRPNSPLPWLLVLVPDKWESSLSP